MTSPLISTAELASRLDDPELRLVDASWHLDGRDGRIDYDDSRLPGAVFFDLEQSSDSDSVLPHMLPSPARFAARMGGLGLSEHNFIVVYDTVGVRTSPRAWWMLTTMGATRVRVLDGGFPKWRTERQPLEHGPSHPRSPTPFYARFDATAVADLDEVRARLAAGEQVLDARSAARFRGQAPEPRAGLRPGHMPGALNLPFDRLVDADGTLKAADQLQAEFQNAGVDLDRPVTTTCGSGVTAAILTLALAELGRSSSLYDGSWSEWGARPDAPIVTD